VVRHLGGHRSHQQPGEAAGAAGADDEQLGAVGGAEQFLSRQAIDRADGDFRGQLVTDPFSASFASRSASSRAVCTVDLSSTG
jgi:hypothetical protein